MESRNADIDALQILYFQKGLLEKMKEIQQNDTYYQSFVVEKFRFISPLEHYIPGVTKLWETKYQMKSQNGETLIQNLIKKETPQ